MVDIIRVSRDWGVDGLSGRPDTCSHGLHILDRSGWAGINVAGH